MASLTSWILILTCALAICFASPITYLNGRAISPDNTCGRSGSGGGINGFTCPTDQPCCSGNGFCGITSAYCLLSAGCQTTFGKCTVAEAGAITPDETCGITSAGSTATGVTQLNHVAMQMAGAEQTTSIVQWQPEWCQATYGACGTDSPVPGPPAGVGISTDSLCGPANGGVKCALNECCSLAGYCGTTSEYCNAPDCQFNYGPACDANKTPSGQSTSSIARPKLGNVLYGSSGIYDCEKPGEIALTFDDGPFIYTSHVLDLLAQYNAKATFFITGINSGKGAIDNPTLPWATVIKRMYNAGHQIASHTWSHADLCTLTSSQRKTEMYKNELALYNIIGVFPTYMRPPYSSCTAECGCEADMEDLGYHIIYFDLDTQDYLNDSPFLIQNSKTIFDSSLNGRSPSTDDFLLISHDIHNQTASVLVEHMLKGLLEKGYRPVTVGQCLGDPMQNWYRSG